MATNDTPDEPDDANAHLRRDRNAHGRFVRSLDTVRRDAAAAEYLADHPGTTYEQIKDLFGYAHRSDAKKAIERAKADVARPAITKLIANEAEELDALYTEACAILRRNHVTVSHGHVVTWRNPETQQEEPLLDDGPKLAALRVALSIRDQYENLFGLKQPAKQEISGGVTYQVVGINPEDLT